MIDQVRNWWRKFVYGNKEIEKNSKESDIFLHSILENIPAMIFIKNAKDLRFKLINKTGEELLGLPREKLIGKNDYDFFPKEQADFFTEKDRSVLAQNSVQDIPEEPIDTKSMGLRWLHTKKIPLLFNEGVPQYLLGISLDVTDKKLATDQIKKFNEELEQRVKKRTSELERKNLELLSEINKRTLAEEAANQSEERYKFLTNAIPQIIWTLDPEGNIDYVNLYAYNYSGVGFEKIKGYGWLDFVHPDDYKKTFEILKHSILTGEPYEAEYRLRRHDGAYIWFLGRALAMKDKQGRVIRWFGGSTDINDHKLALESLAKAKEKLQRVNEELNNKNFKLTKMNADLDNFIYTASHDLKAPVTNIEGLMNMLSDYLLDKGHDGEIKNIMEMIHSSIKRFQTTIKELTEISKTQKNIHEDVTEVNVAEQIEEIINSIKTQIIDSKAEISIETSRAPIVRFSKVNFRSMAYNLLTNAIKYRHPERIPIISLSTWNENEFIVFEVKDNGMGIKAEHLNKIFDMFKRLHNHVEGTGVGLYIVKRIVENAGGSIQVESEPEIGTTFKIFIPK